MITILTLLAGAYCAGCYYFNRHSLLEIFRHDLSWGWRLYHGIVFTFSPVTVPIGLLVLIIAY